jgi:hypothetical protein
VARQQRLLGIESRHVAFGCQFLRCFFAQGEVLVPRGAWPLLLPACGEKVGMRGPLRWAQSCGAQNRGEAPSPSLRIADATHRRSWH